MITKTPNQGVRPAAKEVRKAFRSRQRGQSLIVAIITLFVLLFIGAVFVALVARNLLNAGRSKDATSAYQFAEAGVQYADFYLQSSPEGADWRPAPPDLTAVDANDPDRRYLEQGFTRVIEGNGRFLVRVTMAPNPQNPVGKYIKIESVGRTGAIDPNDPTTFLNSPAPRLRRTIIAYKSIGITDYLRYVTNKSNDTKAVADIGSVPLGVPLAQQYGKLPVRTFGGTPANFQRPGAPMYFNCDVRFNTNKDNNNPTTSDADTVIALDRDNNEAIYVAGKVIVDPNKRPGLIAYQNGTPQAEKPIIGSDEANATFNTYAQLIRDSGPNPDANGFARAISRLEPPVLDAQTDTSTANTRYRLLTRDSGVTLGTAPNSYFAGRIGFGDGIYINNVNDAEQVSQNVQGGQSLRSIWMRPGASGTDWKGPMYVPPGAYIEFGYPVGVKRDVATGQITPNQYVARPGFRILRGNQDRGWVDPAGVVVAPKNITFSFFIYKPNGRRPVLKVENEYFRNYLKSKQSLTDDQVDAILPEFNGVIYTEGNARVRGLLPGKTSIPLKRESGDTDSGITEGDLRESVNPPAITLVSNNNIYIEGSLVREDVASMIALLAKEFVVVNPTLFMNPNKEMLYTSSYVEGLSPYHTRISQNEVNSTPPFALDFMFGDNPTLYVDKNNAAVPVNLLVRHGALGGGPSYLDLFINEPYVAAGQSALYPFNITAPAGEVPYPPHPTVTGSTYIYPLGDTPSQNGGTPQTYYFERTAFPLMSGSTAPSYPFTTTPGVPNMLRFAADPNYVRTSPPQDYLFGSSAIVPMDVRIEAVIYAQNQSFFVIPGLPFNHDPNDTRQNALARAAAAGMPAGSLLRDPAAPERISDLTPFYNEPIDCRITLVGAISENRTATVSDQAAWMQLWGYIPETYGSTYGANAKLIPSAHQFVDEVGSTGTTDNRKAFEQNAAITRGLRFLYDPALSTPYGGYNPANQQSGTVIKGTGWSHIKGGALRQDEYGRVLPPLPRLPVSPGFVFYGEI